MALIRLNKDSIFKMIGKKKMKAFVNYFIYNKNNNFELKETNRKQKHKHIQLHWLTEIQ